MGRLLLADDFVRGIQTIASNAAQLAATIQKSSVEVDWIAVQAWEVTKAPAQQILIEELVFAINKSREYSIPEYAEQLISVFSNPAIMELVNPTLDMLSLRPAVDTIAGSRDDLWRGILLAKGTLGIGDKLTPQQASDFWRDRIYKPAREGTGGGSTFLKKSMESTTNYGMNAYFNTLAARMAEWRDMAPYWIFLDEGNHGGGAGIPYPIAGPTRFVERAERRIGILFKKNIFEMTNSVVDSMTEKVNSFVANPAVQNPWPAGWNIGNILNTYKRSKRLRKE